MRDEMEDKMKKIEMEKRKGYDGCLRKTDQGLILKNLDRRASPVYAPKPEIANGNCLYGNIVNDLGLVKKEGIEKKMVAGWLKGLMPEDEFKMPLVTQDLNGRSNRYKVYFAEAPLSAGYARKIDVDALYKNGALNKTAALEKLNELQATAMAELPKEDIPVWVEEVPKDSRIHLFVDFGLWLYLSTPNTPQLTLLETTPEGKRTRLITYSTERNQLYPTVKSPIEHYKWKRRCGKTIKRIGNMQKEIKTMKKRSDRILES